MPIERTLSIIKPDAVKKNVTGQIIGRFEEKGFKILAQKKMHFTKDIAGRFYEIHKERAFYDDLCAFMSSGPVVVMVLEKEDAVAKNRELMGATNPANAEPGTLRADFAESIEANAVHGSDSLENAQNEIKFFFSDIEILA